MSTRPLRSPALGRRRASRPAVRAALIALPLVAALVLGACGSGNDVTPAVTGEAKTGQDLAKSKNCVSCHTPNGNRSEGPTWKGLYGSTVTLKDGTQVKADDAYLTTAIRDPKAQIVQGYTGIMPTIELSDDEVKALIAYIKALA